MLDAVHAFRHLIVALAEFRTGMAAGRQDRIVADEAPGCVGGRPGPEGQALLALEHQERDLLRRPGHAGALEVRTETLVCRGAVARHHVRDRARTGELQEQRIPEPAAKDIERAAGEDQHNGDGDDFFSHWSLRLQRCV